MAEKLTKYHKLQRNYVKKTNSLYKSNDGKEVLSMLEKGQNSYLKLNRFESSSMDMSWIKRIEDCIPDLGEIVGNPKKTIQTLNEVIIVEKVKKIGSESVQHLAAHTQFVKQIDENGNVTPSKLLNIYVDDFYAIYENKFIATLLRHLITFVEKRYDFILKQAKMSDVSLLYAKNHTEVDDNVIDIETKVRYSRPADFVAADRMKGYLKQIRDIRKYLKFYMHSEFMNILRREKDVRNPILQTNIIRKNPKYHKCYLLWLFIERYRESGIEVKVEENYAQLSQNEIDEINQLMCANFLALKGKDIIRSKKKQKVYKPKILNTYDDEIYKPAYYDGPVEYVRIDDKYREYTESLHDLNPHPTAAMKEYDKEKYEENKQTREKTKQIDSLLSRKVKEKDNYEKGEALAEKHEKERDEYIQAKAEQLIQTEALEKVTKARKKLMGTAKKEKAKIKPAPKKEEKSKPVKKTQEKPIMKVEPIVEAKPEPKVEPKKEEKLEPKVKEVAAVLPEAEPKKQKEHKPVVKKAEPKKEEQPKKAEPKVSEKPKPVKKAEPKKEEKVEKFMALGTFRSKKK
ncbi:MAG: hypothetical protein MJ221_04515 [Bacilli bacterium]|nr:hypothetical protein [Bacilli bacterium]